MRRTLPRTRASSTMIHRGRCSHSPTMTSSFRYVKSVHFFLGKKWQRKNAIFSTGHWKCKHWRHSEKYWENLLTIIFVVLIYFQYIFYFLRKINQEMKWVTSSVIYIFRCMSFSGGNKFRNFDKFRWKQIYYPFFF